MTTKRIRHLPVMVNDEVIGVVSIGDIVKSIIYKQRETIKELESQVIGNKTSE
jgi:CBS domain-containing protein